jgi:hypothetical protein
MISGSKSNEELIKQEKPKTSGSSLKKSVEIAKKKTVKLPYYKTSCSNSRGPTQHPCIDL